MADGRKWRNGFIALAGVMFGVCAILYSLVHDLFIQKSDTVALGDMCVPPENAKKTDVNPHKDLFISCGGFLE